MQVKLAVKKLPTAIYRLLANNYYLAAFDGQLPTATYRQSTANKQFSEKISPVFIECNQ
ncbi:MAG: hypothetical protein MUE44_14030 [Oscillatoriaceae cyanobacterium Prado104]|nr:hypothetical protein [Oscillatoriaceae cyanobacterium Prado104]